MTNRKKGIGQCRTKIFKEKYGWLFQRQPKAIYL